MADRVIWANITPTLPSLYPLAEPVIVELPTLEDLIVTLHLPVLSVVQLLDENVSLLLLEENDIRTPLLLSDVIAVIVDVSSTGTLGGLADRVIVGCVVTVKVYVPLLVTPSIEPCIVMV